MANEAQEKVIIATSTHGSGAVKPMPRKRPGCEESTSRPAYISCPVCHVGYKCSFSASMLDNIEDGIARVLLVPPCNHQMLVFVDSNLRTRAIERIDHTGLVCEHADTMFLENHLKTLEEKHAQLARSENSYNEAFEIMQQIKKVKKELDVLKNKIVIK
ncbi:MAG: hypothetical protein GYA24_01615 [Candidatus Lokiarchaeota archaeon]|nr:hypothetical protein [Candidatus Lokiarchaeota archaeon]